MPPCSGAWLGGCGGVGGGGGLWCMGMAVAVAVGVNPWTTRFPQVLILSKALVGQRKS